MSLLKKKSKFILHYLLWKYLIPCIDLQILASSFKNTEYNKTQLIIASVKAP